MARDIRIHPKLNSNVTNDFPRIDFGGLSASSISLKVDDDGSVVYTGTYGVLFNVTDDKDGLLHSVNDVSGLPILQVWSNDFVQLGKWDKYTLVANYDKVGVGLTAPSAILHISNNGASYSQFLITGSTSQTNPLFVLKNDSGTVSYMNPDGSYIFWDGNFIRTRDVGAGFLSGTISIISGDASGNSSKSGDVFIKTGDVSGTASQDPGIVHIQPGYNSNSGSYGQTFINTVGGNITMLSGGGVTRHQGVIDFSNAKNGIKQGFYNTAVTLAREVVEIGVWDMSSTATIAVAHSLSTTEYLTIRNVTAIIQDDTPSVLYPVTMGDITSLGTKFGVVLESIDSTNFNLRTDTTTYASLTGTGNRGWIYYEYTPD